MATFGSPPFLTPAEAFCVPCFAPCFFPLNSVTWRSGHTGNMETCGVLREEGLSHNYFRLLSFKTQMPTKVS